VRAVETRLFVDEEFSLKRFSFALAWHVFKLSVMSTTLQQELLVASVGNPASSVRGGANWHGKSKP
jgi:hypothetical protein